MSGRIVTTRLPLATVGLAYEVDLAARGGTGPIVWSISEGSLPNGMSLDPSSGRISGTPAHEESTAFTVRVTDGSVVDARDLSILVGEPTVELRVLTRAIPPVWVGIEYEYPLTAIGGVPPFGHDLPVLFDEELLTHQRVWAAAGDPHSLFCVDPRELARCIRARVVPLGDGAS